MNTAQAIDLVENLGEENWLRLCRKPFYRLLHVFGDTTGGFHVQDAIIWDTLTDGKSDPMCDMEHEQRQGRRLGDPCWCNVHTVFQAPGLCGIPAVALALEPQARVVPAVRVGQCHGTAV